MMVREEKSPVFCQAHFSFPSFRHNREDPRQVPKWSRNHQGSWLLTPTAQIDHHIILELLLHMSICKLAHGSKKWISVFCRFQEKPHSKEERSEFIPMTFEKFSRNISCCLEVEYEGLCMFSVYHLCVCQVIMWVKKWMQKYNGQGF